MNWVFYFWLFITYLGSKYFYLAALTTLYLAVNKKLCYKTVIILFFSMWLNNLLKDILKVIGGILIGALMVFAYHLLSNFLEEKVEKISFGLKVFISGFVPLMLFALYVILFFAEASEDVPRICGAYLGFAVGYLLEEKFVGMLDSQVFKFKVLRCFLGLVIVFTAYLFLSIILPVGFYILFIKYALIALLVTVFVPSLIRMLKI